MAQAETLRPDTSFFTGVYERVGRSGAEAPALIDDLVRIAPFEGAWALDVFPCATGAEQGAPIRLSPSEFNEVPNIVEGKAGRFGLWCQYFTDHSNYPILTCQSETGARFTLWPITDERMTACMTAAGQPLP
ncbi:hypothetical protein [Paracoccus sp. IB05]|uniref:hypothetical protein n=1 Tax=Paracoccus sp. IB05 TaxID=2779367 RepID=UPI0018E78665|nr:hypothetical protein [Paracoccus sp. IB05]MBJ2150863.1 hypothetical protein [Paracoccus sp. IB05]